MVDKYAISAKLIDCYKFNEKQRSGKIITLLQDGYSVAFVSDAGTPLISDPGSELVKVLKENEIEITSINNAYLEMGLLNVELMGRGMAWLDTGTPEGLLKAAMYVEAVQSRQGFYIACLEEIAWRRGLITKEQLIAVGEKLKMTEYGQYILSLVEG